jgi:(E)-4-hydroxy-3-methylbut-2-enyl-diphosphate synthase
VGPVKIGGGAPISIQSMTKVPTSEVKAAVLQVKALESAGCEIIRVAVKTASDAKAIKEIKKKIKIPIVADIHFDHRLALLSIKAGADKIRINPGNMRKPDDITAVVNAAKKARIPIRIGVNSGSVVKGKGTGLVRVALEYIKIFEELDFRDIILSLKASDVPDTVSAYRQISKLCDYPLHLGVTAAGPLGCGIVKSAMGIGSLLLEGIGDTIRVSLTADPIEEVSAAKSILSASGCRKFGHEIISCPTCGRCQVDLCGMVAELERELSRLPVTRYPGRSLTIAIMGCEVNGPGEAKDAHIGVAFGKDSGILFRKGKVVKKIAAKDCIKEILKLL